MLIDSNLLQLPAGLILVVTWKLECLRSFKVETGRQDHYDIYTYIYICLFVFVADWLTSDGYNIEYRVSSK